jgi:hypothetical protein
LPFVQILLRALGEAEQKHGEVANAIGNHRPVPSAPARALPRNSLLDDASTKVSIDKPSFRSRDGLRKAGVGYAFASRVFIEQLGCGEFHTAIYSAADYNSRCGQSGAGAVSPRGAREAK